MITQQLQNIFKSSQLIIPELILIIGILGLVIIVSFDKTKSNSGLNFLYSLSLLFIYIYFAIHHYQLSLKSSTFVQGFNNMLYIDMASLFFKQLICLSAFIGIIHARFFKFKFSGEYYILIFCIVLGLSFLTMTTHFLVIFVSLEMVSIASYALVTLQKEKINFEAGIKYLIFGATSSTIMLFGVSLFYGITHSLNFADLEFLKSLNSNSSTIIQIISFLFLGGILFKAAAAPFQSWVPDVYESTPGPIISFLSFAPKAVAFLLIARFIHFSSVSLEMVIIVVAILSLVIGNLSALWQDNTKRMLGYSGIAQSGFILIGLLKNEANDFYGSFFYILAYLPITMGSFFLADLLFKQTNSPNMSDYKGLGQKNVFLGINAVILMMALIGLPPTLGFLSKLVIFSSITSIHNLNSNSIYIALIIFGLLNAAVSIYYYLKIPYYMLVKGSYKIKDVSIDFFLTMVLSYFSITIVFLFFFPEKLSEAINLILFK